MEHCQLSSTDIRIDMRKKSSRLQGPVAAAIKGTMRACGLFGMGTVRRGAVSIAKNPTEDWPTD